MFNSNFFVGFQVLFTKNKYSYHDVLGTKPVAPLVWLLCIKYL